MNRHDIIVIGTGAIGLAIGRRLAGLGAVLVVEKGAYRQESLLGCCGHADPAQRGFLAGRLLSFRGA